MLLIFILITIFGDFDIIRIEISYILANEIALSFAYYALEKNVTKPKFQLDLKFYKEITILSLPFTVISLLYSIY